MDEVTAAVDFGAAPDDEARRRLGAMLERGWIPERVVVRKRFDGETRQDAAEDELRRIMGEYWVEARLA
jgi:hypothetical protein